MSARTGLPEVEVAVLAGIETAVVRAGEPVITERVLTELDRVIGATAAYRLLVDLVAPWRRHLPLVRGEGNWGSQSGDPPADARFTTVELTAVGELAVAAERCDLGPLPLGLIDGSWYRGGVHPPYDPAGILRALATGDVAGLVSTSPTGGTVAGDLAGLAAGEPVALELGSTLVLERRPRVAPPPPCEPPAGTVGGWFAYAGTPTDRGGDRVVITELPYGVDADRAAYAITDRVNADRGPHVSPNYLPDDWQPDPRPPVPIVDVRDHTSEHHGIRILCPLREGTDPESAMAWLRAIWPLTRSKRARLPAPLSALVGDWEAGDGSGLTALAGLIGPRNGPIGP